MKHLMSLLLIALLNVPAFAQEAGQGREPEPPTAGGPTPEEQAAEIEALEPGVPSTILAQEVRRRDTGAGRVMDEMQLGRTEITGNQELPKVLYIVPWKQSDPGDLMGRPVNTLL
ncbi:MAG: hypothetical protein ACE5OQ_07895, partial [Woeseia sp.]